MLETEEVAAALALAVAAAHGQGQLRQPLRVARTRLGRRDEVLLHELSTISNLILLGSPTLSSWSSST